MAVTRFIMASVVEPKSLHQLEAHINRRDGMGGHGLGEGVAAGRVIASQKENQSKDFFDLTRGAPQDILRVR
jgi:hypothetical protein